ncbi:hypothetical protein AB6A40_007753 [Gnathostoma spinigerum]|uniref:Uncharacterized protein n=1 Tax=Gnathostoma spinigerum TaxID=75299 RepID=A0ABD6EM59_9BILA
MKPIGLSDIEARVDTKSADNIKSAPTYSPSSDRADSLLLRDSCSNCRAEDQCFTESTPRAQTNSNQKPEGIFARVSLDTSELPVPPYTSTISPEVGVLLNLSQRFRSLVRFNEAPNFDESEVNTGGEVRSKSADFSQKFVVNQRGIFSFPHQQDSHEESDIKNESKKCIRRSRKYLRSPTYFSRMFRQSCSDPGEEQKEVADRIEDDDDSCILLDVIRSDKNPKRRESQKAFICTSISRQTHDE